MAHQGAFRTMRTTPAVATALLLAALPAAALPESAKAQQAPAAPTREELQAQAPAAETPRQSRLTIEDTVERGPCALADPAMAGVKVNFANVSFTGLPDVPPGALDEAWRDLAGREQPIATLCEVRDRAATMLRRWGFLATVQVPPQRIEAGGTVQFNVLAAKLVAVEVRGRPGHAERQIAAHLRQLTKRPWFNTQEAERQLLLLRDLPGFDVRLTLRSAHAGPGEVIGEVMVERRPVELIVGGQNLSSKATGREGVMAQLTLNDLTGMGDRTVLSVYNTVQTGEQTVVQLAHDFAIGPDGLRLGGRFVYGRARPDIAGGAFVSHTWIGAAELSYPFLRKQTATLLGAAGFEAVDQLIDFGGTRLSADRLRIAYGRLDGRLVDSASLAGRDGFTLAEPRLGLSGSLEVRKGLAGLGASSACVPLTVCLPPHVPITNLAANPQGALVRAEATVEFRPARAVTLVLRPRAQYSSAQLLSYEQFTLGNYTVGRGYDPGAVQGDKGVALGAELRLGRLRPRSAEDIALQPYGFVDAGWAWTNDNGLTPMRHLVSAGGGVRARWGDRGDFNLLLAVPLERVPGQSQLGPARVLLTFTTRLVPWSVQ